MRIAGTLLRTPVTLSAPGESTGDGPGAPVSKTIKGQVTKRVAITNDATGATVSVVATVRIRPTVKVGGRTPQAGDSMTVDGTTRTIASVEPVRVHGTTVAYLELIAGDG